MLLTLFLPLVACSTLETFTTRPRCTVGGFERPAIPWTYSGTRWAWFVWGHHHLGFYYALDLPLSLVADTIALPFTIPKQRRDGDLAPPCDRGETTSQNR
jgi:uncharacterized protein YceK